jgi:hypothetical protein
MYLLASALEEVADEELEGGFVENELDSDNTADAQVLARYGANPTGAGSDAGSGETDPEFMSICVCGGCEMPTSRNGKRALYWMNKAATQTVDLAIALRAQPHVQRLRLKFA